MYTVAAAWRTGGSWRRDAEDRDGREDGIVTTGSDEWGGQCTTETVQPSCQSRTGGAAVIVAVTRGEDCMTVSS